MNFEEYLNSLGRYERQCSNIRYMYITKDKEIAYMKGHTYRFKQIIKSIFPSVSPIKVLDIGPTPFTLFLKRSYPHLEVSALDRTDQMEVRCKVTGIQFQTCDIAKQPLPFEDGYFDLVIFTEVLEHLVAVPTEVLREIGRVMRGGGMLILSVPNLAALIKRIKLLLGISPLPYPDQQFVTRPIRGLGHIREYTMKELTSILHAADFTVSKKKFLQSSLKAPLYKPNKRGFFTLIRVLYYVAALLIPSFRTTIYVECQKPAEIEAKQ